MLGESEYARRLLSGRKVDEQEQTPVRRMRRQVDWEELVAAAERLKGQSWESWAERYGDWGRDAVIYVAVCYGGLRLTEVVRQAGLKYQAAAQAVKRFRETLAEDADRRRFVSRLKRQMSIV